MEKLLHPGKIPSLFLAATLCCWLIAVGLNYTIRQTYPPRMREDLQFIPQKTVIDILCMDNKGLAADLFFIQVILHSGSLTWKPHRFHFHHEWSYKLMDLVTELDPKYYSAYLFSGMGLVHTHEDIYRANILIKKGMKIFPNSWELPFWIGLNAYLYLENDAMASDYLWQAAHKKDAPLSFLSLLLSAITKGGELKHGLWVLETMIKHEKNPKIRTVYKKRIVRLTNLIDLNKAADIYKKHFQKNPFKLTQLVDAGILKNIPNDPMGCTYAWNDVGQRVECRDSQNNTIQ